MDDRIRDALERGGIIDITTTGAKSGAARRIEIAFHYFDGEYFITGRPGFRRDWLANLKSNPEFTVHLKRDVQADVEARAIEISDPERRSQVLYRILTESWDNEPAKAEQILPQWVESAPLVEFELA
ncbi:MAG: nitroreductase family deazaflavin-dependent oxidoreductase [Acidimicrobiia bacterium]|nr:nitroreductase family deazaflavin-dependent oxidoreductase [Acidimicrobiia bacterium]NNL27999.1 nitroreductase family deazaflavin-dependent oxidoreductase [Acidimicrobiia bacterium]